MIKDLSEKLSEIDRELEELATGLEIKLPQATPVRGANVQAAVTPEPARFEGVEAAEAAAEVEPAKPDSKPPGVFQKVVRAAINTVEIAMRASERPAPIVQDEPGVEPEPAHPPSTVGAHPFAAYLQESEPPSALRDDAEVAQAVSPATTTEVHSDAPGFPDETPERVSEPSIDTASADDKQAGFDEALTRQPPSMLKPLSVEVHVSELGLGSFPPDSLQPIHVSAQPDSVAPPLSPSGSPDDVMPEPRAFGEDTGSVKIDPDDEDIMLFESEPPLGSDAADQGAGMTSSVAPPPLVQQTAQGAAPPDDVEGAPSEEESSWSTTAVLGFAKKKKDKTKKKSLFNLFAAPPAGVQVDSDKDKK